MRNEEPICWLDFNALSYVTRSDHFWLSSSFIYLCLLDKVPLQFLIKEARFYTLNKLSILKETVKDQSSVSFKYDFPPITVRFSCLNVFLACIFGSMETVKLSKILSVNNLIFKKSKVYIDVAPNHTPLLKLVWKLNLTVFYFFGLWHHSFLNNIVSEQSLQLFIYHVRLRQNVQILLFFWGVLVILVFHTLNIYYKR